MKELKTNPIIKRHPANPILSAKDVLYDAMLVFNAGVTKYQGKYVMVFRNDFGSVEEQRLDGTNLGVAYSDDGIIWKVQPKPCLETKNFADAAWRFYAQRSSEEIRRAYDPRLTVIDGRCYMCFAVDTCHGVRGGIAVTDDFDHFEILTMTVPDNRNIVLFPEKVGNKYVRLERPFLVFDGGCRDKFDIWLSDSPNLKYWGNSDLVLGVEDVPFANNKIGPAAPPVKTPKGWLTIFHAVDIDTSRGKNGWEKSWKKRYTAGIMLLDLNNPIKIIGMSKEPLIVPEAPYEISGGFRNNVVFPGGIILEDTGEVKIYYGAADTVECLATAHIDDLLKLCSNV